MLANKSASDVFRLAAKEGRVDVVQFLIERGVIKDDADGEGMTALYLAAENDHLPVVQYLVEQGADKDKVMIDGTSPLSIAAENGHLSVVQCLGDVGADKDKADNEGFSPVSVASQNGHLGVVQYLVELGADKDKAINNGASPLYISAQEGHLPVVQYLVEIGVDKEKATNNAWTALIVAAQNGHLAVVQCLVEHGADKDEANNNGTSPLFVAAENDHLPVVQYLVKRGADKDKADNDGSSPLFVAAQNGRLGVVQYLVELGADKDKTNNNSTSPLFVAALKGHLGVVQYLVEMGSDKEKADNDGWTALIAAAQKGHLAVVQYLVEQGADKDKTNNNDNCPLIFAAQEGHLGMVQYLIEIGMDKEKANNEGWTALLVAAQNGHLEVVKHLLEHDTDVDKADNDGWSPLHAAAFNGHAEVVTCLMKWAAVLTAKTTDGRLPIDVAANEAIKQLIRDEEDRDKNNGYKRAVIPDSIAAEQPASKRARLKSHPVRHSMNINVPYRCCCCDGHIAKTKAVLLPCECKHAFCLDCARSQLFETMREEVIGIGEVSVSCPSCKQRPVVSKEGKGSNLVTSSVLAAQSAEQALIQQAMSFSHQEVQPSRHGTTNATMYLGVLEAYQKLGLLTDIPPLHRRQGAGFIRLCLARAEAYRQQLPPAPHEGAPPTIIPTNELPLGPLEQIKLLHHKQLDRYLHAHGKNDKLNNECGICGEPMCLKGPVFTMCECTEMYCRGCVLNTLATFNHNDFEVIQDSRSYLSPDLPRRGERLVTSVQCPSCRSESYSVFGVEDARAEEERLLRNQFPQLPRGVLKKKQNENGLYIDHIGECCRQLVQEPRLHGEYEPLFPEASKTQLLKFVGDRWLSSAQREAARLCALLESGPGDPPPA